MEISRVGEIVRLKVNFHEAHTVYINGDIGWGLLYYYENYDEDDADLTSITDSRNLFAQSVQIIYTRISRR